MAIGEYVAPEDGEDLGARSVAIELNNSAEIPDGATFEGPIGLKAALLAHPDRFVTTATDVTGFLLFLGLGSFVLARF